MTRKDFILIANAMKEATTFAIYKQSAEARSQQACGLDEETIQNL